MPVLPAAIASCFADPPPGLMVDCTLGLGGHARILLEQNPALKLLGLDLDADNLEQATRQLAEFGDRVRLIQASFADLASVLADLGIAAVGGVLADLGVSSSQLADGARGFSFEVDGPLDMRLDQRCKTTAADLINSLPEGELADLLYLQSQERHSRRIARRICQARRQGRLNSTVRLARLVASAVGADPDSRRCRKHPATRTFMALRIAVNREIDALRALVSCVPEYLAPGGRIAAISFHSLEDRVVKRDFKERSRNGVYRILTKKPIVADEDERSENPRSRPAKLRIAERITCP
ncbi:MAG: 16S rRNA (cytosine(1402)-N(4))-methyltransferase RsmH [Planctomycetota bacterium]